jgi:SPOR domain
MGQKGYMDQENSKGQDKRNWRERLGIGAQGNVAGQAAAGAPGNKDLPKISENYRKDSGPPAGRSAPPARPASRPIAAAAPAVRPAPMAPRANPKAPPPSAPVAPDKLAERLRSQREASTKLAEQRVQVAKQRGETPPVAAPAAIPQPNGTASPKPKFGFAEDAEAKANPPQARPSLAAVVAPPPAPPAVQPQMSPARPPLGGGMPPLVPNYQTRPQPAQFPPQQPPSYSPAGQMPPGFPQQGYGQQPVPPYRPIDPATGYAPPPGYVPQQRGFGLPPQQGGFVPPPSPRLNMPPRPAPGVNANYQPQAEYGAAQPQPGGFAPPPRMSRPPMRSPVAAPVQDPAYEEDLYDEVPQPRGSARPTSTDYQQAYREAEYGYEDEVPRSKAPWILASLLLLALLVAGLGVLGYQKYWKPMITGQTATQEVPAVAPSDTPAKVQAEQPATAPPAGGVATPTKKQIYDRIVGDQEILGGDVSAPTETPAAIPEPSNANPPAAAAPPPATGSGEDAVPLPIPPPPGGAGGQQGSVDPGSDPVSEKQSAELNSAAAGESQAAVAAATPPPSPVAEPSVPGETASAPSPSRSLAVEPIVEEPAASEAIAETLDPPAVAPKKPEKKRAQPVKEKVASTKLGSKPVVLVAPAKKLKSVPSKQLDDTTDVASNSDDTGGGLFGDGQATGQVVAPSQPVVAPAPVKKKRTLADLFSRNSDAAPDQVANVGTLDQATPLAKPAQRQADVPAPAPAQQSSSLAGDFVVQLASFRTKAEASAEFSRLQSKHVGVLGQFSPIISEANVGGSTRFRLSVGRMSSETQASSVCSKLFASGERDCLVKRR